MQVWKPTVLQNPSLWSDSARKFGSLGAAATGQDTDISAQDTLDVAPALILQALS